MKHEKLSDALQNISDRHIAEAAARPKKKALWIAPLAASLALILVLTAVLWPQSQPAPIMQNPDPVITIPLDPDPPAQWQPVQPAELLSNRYAIATPSYPVLSRYPTDGHDQDAYKNWSNDQKVLHNQPKGYADSLQACWDQLLPTLLNTKRGENVACSPINVYMALAMLAECTDGQSRQQLLELLNADNIEALRTQAQQVWRAHYNDDGLSKSVLANSLWLEKDYGFDPSTVALLAAQYYASVFQGDLGSAEMNTALQSWLNEQTEGLLDEQVQHVSFDANTVLALASTINYQVQWLDEFSDRSTTAGIFHGANGDTAEIFMHKQLMYGPYYWSDNFGAIALSLEDVSRMWLILPDEGVRPESITEEVAAFLRQTPDNYENMKQIKVNLSLPKFDVSGEMELSLILRTLGVTDIFTPGTANFSAILPEDDGGFVSSVKHAARVLIDEKGVTAVAFTTILRAGASIPPEDSIDFVLDRPFIFCVESRDGLPLFAGIVNEP